MKIKQTSTGKWELRSFERMPKDLMIRSSVEEFIAFKVQEKDKRS